MYDPTRDTYHLMYQWHPYHINWGMQFVSTLIFELSG